MMTSLREAKSCFSELVKRAAEGEEILITVRGEPTAGLAGLAPAGGRGSASGSF